MKLHHLAPLTLCLALVGLQANLHAAPQDDQYVPGPDSQLHPDVPRGKVVPMPPFQSKIYEGTTRDWWLYVPAQYDASKPACVMVFQDGGGSKGDPKQAGPMSSTYVFDNLIAAKKMPVTIGIYITPGSFPASDPNQKPRSNRSVEYDTPDGTFARFLLEEILPEVSKQYKLTDKPEERAISGNSSGGICAFKVAWERPDMFQKVVSHIGSFTNIRGGNIYQDAVRKTEAKAAESVYVTPEQKKLLELRRKIRVFLQDGKNDIVNQAGSWPAANQEMAESLKLAGWDYMFVFGEGTHSGQHGTAIFPDTMRWLWRDVKPD